MSAKDILLRPISKKEADALVRKVHYSGKVVPNSQFHIGVFWRGRLEGALQFGPSMDKRKVQGLVEGTGWNEFIELNRMAFSDVLPRNSESRALAVAFRILRQHAPFLKWVISYSDAAQCGDGTIYRASGFVLTGIRENRSIYEFPNGERIAQITLTAHWAEKAAQRLSASLGVPHRYRPMGEWVELGAKPVAGYQLRYIYFLDPEARQRLTVPEIPFARIKEMGAGMYKGQPR